MSDGTKKRSMKGRQVFFMDIATNAGWCEGAIGGRPVFGSMRLAPEGSSSMAVHAGLFKFIANRFQAFKPSIFVYEQPINPMGMMGRTTIKTIRLLVGLPAVAECAAYLCGVYDVRETNVQTVRKFILPPAPKGQGRKEKGAQKKEVFEHICGLGYEPQNTDEADAIAGWLYACSVLDPTVGVEATPLFKG